MKILRQICIILFINFIGEIIHLALRTSIPGNVIGMILLLVLLCTGLMKLELIEEISDFFLKNLAFFFLPAGVGLISCMSLLSGNWGTILLICLLSTIVVIVVTGFTIQILKKTSEKMSN
ncbi:CidA/LrgA family protein [Haloimpatiens lingqiaonensis]|uniref:CidA/LrgA family protein n=1 Tax=Haloimpatiens lingqiaonensis TaxID=1380675 RepID=UPI0010FEF960|nr:CidA/LrgA family protein [Haloimpatiens lingqiaonensis]